MKKRLLAILLAAAMLLSIAPLSAFAEVSSPADYKVTVGVSTTTDRDATNPMVDVFAGDQVTVTVTVSEADFVAADITLTYDTANFALAEEAPTGWDTDDYPDMVAEGDTPTGKIRFYNAKSQGGKWDDGMVLGTFTFTALPGEDAAMNVPFKIKAVEEDEHYPETYVAKEWSAGWDSTAAVPVNSNNLTNGYANIRLKEMTASVTAESGLSYKGDNTPLKLVKDGYTAKDNSTGKPITDATIKYAVLTKAEVEGTVQKKDGDGNLLYVDPANPDNTTIEPTHNQYYTDQTKMTKTTDVTPYFDVIDNTPEYEPAKTPAAADYGTTNPSVNHAGDYVLFYQIARNGFVTVSDKVEVSVAKASVTLTWTASELESGSGKTDGKGEAVTTDYFKAHEAGTTYANPVATYTNLTMNTTANAVVTEANGGVLNATGEYTFTATISDDYTITNPTVTVLIDGGKITGYTLENTDEGTEEWYDGAAHDVAKLTEAENRTPDVTVQYSIDGGTTWSGTMPKVTEVGKYEVQTKLTKAGYYDQIQKVNFEIKNVEYKVEKSDWVTGWDIVLVYTNDTVPGFKYNGKMMYNLSNMAEKYKYNNTAYTYVYGLVINGDADITKVVPSNEAATAIDYNGDADGTGTQASQYDVNSSNNVDINDLVAVQGIYNVDNLYMNDTQMSVVLRADVNRDKKVDTMDCSQIKLKSGNSNSNN